MITDFLHNPINTAIIGAVVVFAISAIIYIVLKKNITFSKEHGLRFQTAEQSMTYAIPRIDDYMKSQLYSILNNNKDRILGTLNDFYPVERMLIAKTIIEVIKERININHFATIMSSATTLQLWIEDRIISVLQKTTYCMDYCKITNLDNNLLAGKLNIIFNDCMEVFSESVMSACYEKIEAYNRHPNDTKCKKNINKNEIYVENIRTTFTQLKKNKNFK